MSLDQSPQFILSPHFLDAADTKLRTLGQNDWTIIEPEVSGNDKQSRISSLLAPLSAAVCEARRSDRMPVAVAGDCCAAIGVLAGLQQAGVEPTLLWFDAHGDFNTWETSPSGFLGGMPLAMITGRGEQTMAEAVDLKTLRDDRVMLVDARDLDPGERELLQASGVTMVPNVETLLSTPLPSGPLYIHFDSDVICAEEVPAQRYPVSGGPDSQTVSAAFRRIAASGQLAGVSMSAWHTAADRDGSAQATCMATHDALVGHQ